MISTRSKWWAVALAAARAASSCFPCGDFVSSGCLDWSAGVWVMLCAKAGVEPALKRVERMKATVRKVFGRNIQQEWLISLFVTQRPCSPSNRIDPSSWICRPKSAAYPLSLACISTRTPKAKNLRSRVASYFHEARWEDAKTGTLVREAVDVDYIVVANNKEALALENHLIKQKKPRFNILLRDDKTYPYVKLTLAERFPRVYVTRRLRKDGSAYYGPFFPANLAYRIVDLIHRHFLVPSCKVDLTRYHPRACLQYYIKRCLGPCVEGLTTPELYQEAVRDVKLFLEGRPTDLLRSLRRRMEQTAEAEEYERAAKYRDLISTVDQLQEKQRIAAVEGDDADVFGFHYENGMLAVNLFHMRGGRVLDRREFFWEDLPEVATDHVGADAPSRPAEPSSAAEPVRMTGE